MSLINDALRRAKEAQEQAPSPESPQLPFRPVEPAQEVARRGLGLMLPVAMAGAALLTLFSIWRWSQAHLDTVPTEVNARAKAIPPVTTPAPALAVQPARIQAPVAPAPSTARADTPVGADAAVTPTDDLFAEMEEGDATDASAMPALAPPKPAPLRLQAIVFNPRRPSAMVSGKTLFVGDKLGDLRVVSISKDSAILVGGGQTNILTLSE